MTIAYTPKALSYALHKCTSLWCSPPGIVLCSRLIFLFGYKLRQAEFITLWVIYRIESKPSNVKRPWCISALPGPFAAFDADRNEDP